MIKLSTLRPGDVVYDCHMQRMGNTMMREMGVWTVVIKEVHLDKNRVLASWNGNVARPYHGPTLSWRRWPPEWIRRGFSGAEFCSICHQERFVGHTQNCPHPKAVKARKGPKP